MGGFDDMEAKAREQAEKYGDEAKQRGEEEIRERAPEYEKKGKDFAEDEAQKLKERF